MEEKGGGNFQKRKKVNIKIKQDFQIWLLVRIMGTVLLALVVASILSYLYSKGVVDADQLSFKADVRKTSEVMLPVLLAASLTSIIAGLLLALFLPPKIAGPIYRVEQDLLQIGKGDLSKTITLRSNDILVDLAESVNMAVDDIGKIIKDIKGSGDELEKKIIADKLEETKKAYEFHKIQLDSIITKP